jgi:sugar-specific transcriptional regulator TrmB
MVENLKQKIQKEYNWYKANWEKLKRLSKACGSPNIHATENIALGRTIAYEMVLDMLDEAAKQIRNKQHGYATAKIKWEGQADYNAAWVSALDWVLAVLLGEGETET